MNSHLHITRLSLNLGQPQPLSIEPAVWAFTASKPLLLLRGQNGVGKTTLLNVLSGHLSPLSGTASLDGVVLTGRGPRWSARQGVIRSYQFPLVCDELSVWENVALPLLRNCFSRPQQLRPRVERLLADVGLLEKAEVSPAELSFGQRRLTELLRVEAQLERGIARLVLLDEPFAGLDPNHRIKAFALLTRIATTGVPILLVEHDHDLGGLDSLLSQKYMTTAVDGVRRMDDGPTAC